MKHVSWMFQTSLFNNDKKKTFYGLNTFKIYSCVHCETSAYEWIKASVVESNPRTLLHYILEGMFFLSFTFQIITLLRKSLSFYQLVTYKVLYIKYGS